MEQLQIRIFGDAELPTLVYLPGLHGDWTLITSFRTALKGRARFVEITYPRSLTWTILDYATAIKKALRDAGIANAWLLGESFGAQIAWELIGTPENYLRFDGVILAGGFVKHPWKWGPSALRWLGGRVSNKGKQRLLKIYARFRHRRAPETLAGIQEVVERRTELDRQAMQHRLCLLDEYDPRSIARQTQVPIYYLAGSIDPLVPWPLVRGWLRSHCRSYRCGRTLWLADHNVLATAPIKAANQVLKWMTRESKQPTTS
jgi:pimeloyl-ACP methyl ester carboxylesterase